MYNERYTVDLVYNSGMVNNLEAVITIKNGTLNDQGAYLLELHYRVFDVDKKEFVTNSVGKNVYVAYLKNYITKV